MRKVWLGLAAAILGVAVPGTGAFVTAAQAATHGVSIVGVTSGFSPANITISAGDTVTWTNNDPTTTHTATSADSPAAFDSGNLAPGGVGTYGHTFNDPGEYAYHCSIHSNMTGSVFVQGPSTTSTSSPPASTSTTTKATTTSSSLKPTTTTSSSSTSTTEPGTSTSESSTSTTDLVAAGTTKHKGGAGALAALIVLIVVVAGGGGFAFYRLRAAR